MSFSVDTNCILSARSPRKCSTAISEVDVVVNSCLCTCWRFEFPFRIHRLEYIPIWYNDPDELVRKVNVSIHPVLWGPGTMSESNFSQQHVRECVANGLVDEIDEGIERFKGMLLARGLRIVAFDDVDGVVIEEDCAVAIGFEVDTNVKSFSGVMQMFDTSWGAIHWQFHHLLYVFGRGAVGVSGLDDPNLELVANTSNSRLISDEVGGQSCYPVTIKEMEFFIFIDEIIDYAISISIERAATLERRGI
jgi:hypothetical protein